MDALITAAARALAAGDPLGALNRVALRDDPPALALRGIAMAQLGDLPRARALVRAAARGFGPREAVARARCAVAEAEIALVSRDLGWPERSLDAARKVLQTHGDLANAAHAQYLIARHQLLVGQIVAAESTIADIDPVQLPSPLRAAHELVVAGIAVRRLHGAAAQAAMTRAAEAAAQAGIPALRAEVEHAALALRTPVARLLVEGGSQPMMLQDVEQLFASDVLVIDACRMSVRQRETVVQLARRPVLFSLARALAEPWPDNAPRDTLIAQAFRTRHADETHRARLRVEIGRLRAVLASLADISATPRGFALMPRDTTRVAVLTHPVEEPYVFSPLPLRGRGERIAGGVGLYDARGVLPAAVLACLSDGESWSSSALALALGTSQRAVQRALETLAEAGKVEPVGRGRARRWMTPVPPGFATALLLPVPLPGA
ncbi:helix-turn-helix domain-containing protein [Cupriavidus sp. DL-D2]|uniref:helix-turn-helix domain-containing protein n=1 Tax=Cupriavidus sp. DL-D2 TaxID=3144974 RepID=UPI003213DB7D